MSRKWHGHLPLDKTSLASGAQWASPRGGGWDTTHDLTTWGSTGGDGGAGSCEQTGDFIMFHHCLDHSCLWPTVSTHPAHIHWAPTVCWAAFRHQAQKGVKQVGFHSEGTDSTNKSTGRRVLAGLYLELNDISRNCLSQTLGSAYWCHPHSGGCTFMRARWPPCHRLRSCLFCSKQKSYFPVFISSC